MEDPNNLRKQLRQILSQEANPILSEEEIELSIQEMKVMQLVGDRWVVWLNPARAFPAACGGVSEHLWNNNWIEDSSRLAARSFN